MNERVHNVIDKVSQALASMNLGDLTEDEINQITTGIKLKIEADANRASRGYRHQVD